ncbi:MAG: hypothetical protein DELT_03193 [Desulfovibrio sp.]
MQIWNNIFFILPGLSSAAAGMGPKLITVYGKSRLI